MKKLVSDSFIKKIEHISGLTVRNIIKVCFCVCPGRDLPKCIKTNGQLLLPFYLIFLKEIKKRSGTSLPASFSP